jgi:hypothetical protein
MLEKRKPLGKGRKPAEGDKRQMTMEGHQGYQAGGHQTGQNRIRSDGRRSQGLARSVPAPERKSSGRKRLPSATRSASWILSASLRGGLSAMTVGPPSEPLLIKRENRQPKVQLRLPAPTTHKDDSAALFGKASANAAKVPRNTK